MELRVAEGMLLRSGNHERNQKSSNRVEAIASQVRGGGGVVLNHSNEDGSVRMKIMVRKQDLKQVLDVIDKCAGTTTTTLSMEQRLNLLRRKHRLRACSKESRSREGCSWTPTLQSIPEDFSNSGKNLT
ncbi:hypothetical protein HS088_TW07G01370 [Tripterygium wilfordii]|uniref:Uncharacterized protein n=1 Tax=Tripterygium wilfordii TaxID=458696 RepID=A0A7J7DHE6_TRIWF|nr:hypothetical protein HS088_TW07G01370 [Tripterygium wilfordii]